MSEEKVQEHSELTLLSAKKMEKESEIYLDNNDELSLIVDKEFQDIKNRIFGSVRKGGKFTIITSLHWKNKKRLKELGYKLEGSNYGTRVVWDSMSEN